MKVGLISRVSLSQAQINGLDLVATLPNSILAHHHLINRPFGPNLVPVGRTLACYFLLDRKPKRVGALIVAEINTQKICFFNYTGI
jgi:hypothetical protein